MLLLSGVTPSSGLYVRAAQIISAFSRSLFLLLLIIVRRTPPTPEHLKLQPPHAQQVQTTSAPRLSSAAVCYSPHANEAFA